MDRGGEPRWSRGGVRSPLVSATSTADTDTTFERAATDPCGVPTMLLGAERERTAEADREELVEDDVERPWLPPRGGGGVPPAAGPSGPVVIDVVRASEREQER